MELRLQEKFENLIKHSKINMHLKFFELDENL